MLRPRIAGALIAVGLVLSIASLPTFAGSGATPVGTFFISDRGGGAHFGGTLLSGGTATGGGEFAFSVLGTREVAHIQPIRWSRINATTVLLCVTVTGVRGTAFPVGVPVSRCLELKVTGAAGQPGFFGDQGTFYKLILF